MQDVTAPREKAEPDSGAAAQFDFTEPAELFTRQTSPPRIAASTTTADAVRARSRATYRKAIAYRRFASGTEAIRFAIEELPPEALAATVLVVDGIRHEPAAIRALYASAAYPLGRRPIPVNKADAADITI